MQAFISRTSVPHVYQCADNEALASHLQKHHHWTPVQPRINELARLTKDGATISLFLSDEVKCSGNVEVACCDLDALVEACDISDQAVQCLRRAYRLLSSFATVEA